DHPRALAFSPSGHRVYVALRGGLGLAVIDRYAREEIDGVALPSSAATIRIDPLGRWLLARPPVGDTAWVVDLPIKRLGGGLAEPRRVAGPAGEVGPGRRAVEGAGTGDRRGRIRRSAGAVSDARGRRRHRPQARPPVLDLSAATPTVRTLRA